MSGWPLYGHPLFYFKKYILINVKRMMYKSKIETLLEVLDSKLRIIDNVVSGSMKLSNNDLIYVINDCKRIKNQISELISIERNELA